MSFIREGAPHNKLITYVKDRPGHDRRYAVDCGKLQAELGWKPAESFEGGIRKTVEWYLGKPALGRRRSRAATIASGSSRTMRHVTN